jgi:hypothetical protein
MDDGRIPGSILRLDIIPAVFVKIGSVRNILSPI